MAMSNGSINRGAAEAKEFVGRAADAAQDGFNRATDYVADQMRNASSHSGEMSSWAADQLDMLRTKVQEEPIKALAITAGIGAVLGMIFLRR